MNSNTQTNEQPAAADTIQLVLAQLAVVKKQLDMLQASMNVKFASMNDKLDLLTGEKAKTLASAYTRTISISRVKDAMSGHGLLLDINGERYVATAAHVAVELCHREGNRKLKLSWSSSATVDADPKNLFLPERYVESGSNDIGLIQVKFSDDVKLQCHAPIESVDGFSVGGLVVGKGTNRFHIEGKHVLSLESGRQMVDSPSIPEMNGCPLFDATGRLFGFIHGESKHRTRRSASDLDNPSPYLYADGIINEKGGDPIMFRLVKPEYFSELWLAEGLPGDLPAKLPSSRYSQKELHFFVTLKKALVEEDQTESGEQTEKYDTVDSLMSLLAKKCFEDEPKPFLSRGSITMVKSDSVVTTQQTQATGSPTQQT